MTQTAQKPAHPVCKACGDTAEDHIGHKNDYDLMRCDTCRTITVNPWPTVDELTRFYQEYKGTPDYLKKRESKLKRARGRISRLTKLNAPGKRFLDVGCNIGYIVAAANELGMDAKGIDIDEDTIALARKEFGDHFETVSVEDVAARGDKADIIYTSEVIEHVPDPDAFVSALATILPTGGLLYLTTPDGAHFRLPKDFTKWEACCPPEHITYFSKKGVAALLARHGLKVKSFAFNLKPGIKLIAVKE